jgi:hypothetical protein
MKKIEKARKICECGIIGAIANKARHKKHIQYIKES